MSVYLLHFHPSYKHAVHYLGWSPEVQARINAHVNGKGARLTQVAYDAGCTLIWVRLWEDGDRKLERRLKGRQRRYLCPICCGLPVQLPLMPWMPAYVPQDEQEQPESGNSDQPQHTDSLFDFDAEAEDYEEDIADRNFWRRGCW